MRNDKVAVGYPPGAELDDVEIQGPGSPMLGPFPPLLALDRLAGLKQGARLQTGLQ